MHEYIKWNDNFYLQDGIKLNNTDLIGIWMILEVPKIRYFTDL